MIFKIIVVFLVLLIIFLLSYKKIQSWIDYFNEQREIEFKKRTNLDLWRLTRISARQPFMWGLEKLFFNNTVLYFDENNLYIIKYNKPVIKYVLSSIIELTKTYVTINDRRVWKMIIDDSGKQITYKLRSNNRNFDLFLAKVSENPNAVVDSKYVWGFFE
jgi:hypothetical protein